MANNLDNYRAKDTSQGYAWIKIRTNLLDEPAYMRLSDMAKVAYFEAYLLAGKADAGGLILAGDNPASIQDLAWIMRKPEDDLQKALAELERAGLAELQDGQITICRFANEQGPAMADKRKEWAMRQAKKRALAKGEDWSENTADIDENSEPEPDEKKEPDESKEKEKKEDSELENIEIQTKTKRVTRPSRESHVGVTRDIDSGSNLDEYKRLILTLWQSITGKKFTPNGKAFDDLVQYWINAGVKINHIQKAIEQNKALAETPFYLRDIAVKIKDNDPQMVARKSLDKFKAFGRSIQSAPGAQQHSNFTA